MATRAVQGYIAESLSQGAYFSFRVTDPPAGSANAMVLPDTQCASWKCCASLEAVWLSSQCGLREGWTLAHRLECTRECGDIDCLRPVWYHIASRDERMAFSYQLW